MVLTGLPGGAKGDRTPDLGIANAALSQLSYRPFQEGEGLLGSGTCAVKAGATLRNRPDMPRPDMPRPDMTRPSMPRPDPPPPALAPACSSHYIWGRKHWCIMNPFIWLVLTILNIYFWVILISVIMSWLIAFGIMNRQNPYVRQIDYALSRLTEPVLGPIRRVMPDLGGLDVSPVVALIGIQFLQYLIAYYVPRFLP